MTCDVLACLRDTHCTSERPWDYGVDAMPRRRFSHAKSLQNSVYRIEYRPPAHVHVEYRMNVHKLTDVSKTIDERGATFDGPMHCSNM